MHTHNLNNPFYYITHTHTHTLTQCVCNQRLHLIEVKQFLHVEHMSAALRCHCCSSAMRRNMSSMSGSVLSDAQNYLYISEH